MIPRFSGDGVEEERTQYDEDVFQDGVKQRKNGFSLAANPWDWNASRRECKLWMAGWADQDMIELVEGR